MTNKTKPDIAPAHTVLRDSLTEIDDAEVALALATTEAEAAIAKAELMLGHWYEGARESAKCTFDHIPPQYANWHFYRCGVRGVPDAEQEAAWLREWGYRPAPTCVRIIGAFQKDGENGLYVMAPPEVLARLREYRKGLRVKRERARRGLLSESIDRLNNTLGRDRAYVRDADTGQRVDPGSVYDEIRRP